MADDVQYTSTNPAGVPDTTKQVTDEHAARGHMPVVKLAVSADGDATLLTATAADGMLVNLGANNDVTVTGNVNADTELPAAAALSDAAANPTTPTVGSGNLVYNGATWDRARGDIANGLDVDVTRLPALPAGGNNIGDVDVLSVIPGTGATNLGKAEDDGHNSGDVGVMALAVRKDSAVVTGGTDGDYSAVIVDGQGRQWVRPAPVQLRIQNTPTISNGAAYTSGDVLGGLQTLSNAARISGGSGIIQSITVLDKTQAQRAAIDLLFFDRSVTVAADNAAVAMSDADMAFCLGIVSIGPYNAAWPGTPLNSEATLLNVGLPFVLNGTDLFVVAVVRGTPTYTSTSDLIFSYTILQD